VSSDSFEALYGVRLTLFIIFHHRDPFHTACPWFHCIPTISVILGYFKKVKNTRLELSIVLGKTLGRMIDPYMQIIKAITAIIVMHRAYLCLRSEFNV